MMARLSPAPTWFSGSSARTSSIGDELTGIAKVEAIDADTLRFTSATSNPIVWDDLPGVAIMSKAWAERHGAELPSHLGDDRWDYTETHANGTGPFMLNEFEPGKRTVLVRNPDWWDLAQHPHNLDRIVQTKVADPALGAGRSRLASLTCSSRRRATSSSRSPPRPA